MDTEVKNNIDDKIKIDLAYNNYYDIISKKLPYKFVYLDDCLLKKSKILKREAEFLEKKINGSLNTQEKGYRTYQRETIIKADFGIGIGSEMSQVHFAIVINNYDNPKNNVLTVIPLTSKENRFNLYLGTLIIDLLLAKVKNEFKSIKKIKKKNEILNAKELAKLKKLNTLISYYKSNVKGTFACCNLITTISKERIFPPINEYDIIGRARCSNKILNDIDNQIKNNFILTSSEK